MSQPVPAPAAVPPSRVKPPLPAREKQGALLAGGVGFALLTLGFGLFMIPITLLVIGAFFALIIGAVQRATDDPGLGGFERFIESVDPGAWILPLVIVALVGLALMVGALIVSARILRSRGVRSPWGVTWAGAGIAIVASWIVSGVLSVPLQFAGVFRDDGDPFGGPAALVAGVLSSLVGIAVTVAIGALSWWWMAHVMRPADRTP